MKIVHVNTHVVRRNKKHNRQDPPLIVRGKTRSEPVNYTDEIRFYNEDNILVARLTYAPHHPLDCGARVYLEVYEGLELKFVPQHHEEICDA